MAEHSADVVVELDDNLEVVYVSPSVEAALDLTPSQFTERFSDLFSDSSLFRNLKNDITTQKYKPLEARLPLDKLHHSIVTPNQRALNLEVGITTNEVEGSQHYVLTIQDVTKQAVLHGQLAHAQRIESIGQLASGIAHDFNNVLAIIQGNAEIIEFAPDQAKDSIEAILRSVERGHSLTEQILTFSRKDSTVKVSMDVVQVLQESIDLFATIKPDSIAITKDLPDNQVLIQGEASQLSQVFLNIAVNAKDAMVSGGVIEVSARVIHPDNGQSVIRIAFKDNGVGISAKVQERIFEPYFTTKQSSGTGLGLANCKSIIEEHDGSILVDSKPNEGALFRIEIPISESSAQDDLSLDDTNSNDKLDILIVDDNLELLELIQRTLTRLDHQVESAEHGQEALEQISKQHFDLVISDVNMPHMDGIELSKRVSDIPIILMSGYTSQAMIKQIDEGSILKKPFKMSQLVDRIKQEVERPTQPS